MVTYEIEYEFTPFPPSPASHVVEKKRIDSAVDVYLDKVHQAIRAMAWLDTTQGHERMKEAEKRASTFIKPRKGYVYSSNIVIGNYVVRFKATN